MKAQLFTIYDGKVSLSSDILDIKNIGEVNDQEHHFDWTHLLVEEPEGLTLYKSLGSDRNPYWSCVDHGVNHMGLKFASPD